MAKGVSLHIGVGKLSSHYQNTNFGNMPSAIRDANDILEKLPNRFEKKLLPNATIKQVRENISKYSGGENKLSSGDILVVTYAGHGGFIPDEDCIEGDCRNETWCLHDSQLLDDELLEEWTKFDEGVRILVISDSCHSGTILDLFKIGINKELEIWLTSQGFDLKNFEKEILLSKGVSIAGFNKGVWEKDKKLISELLTSKKINVDVTNLNELEITKSQVRTLPLELLRTIYKANESDYTLRKRTARENLEKKLRENFSNGFNGLVKASVLLLSACQDDQLAELDSDGRNGLFTKHLLEEWNEGKFTGNYLHFHQAIWKKIKHKQSPNYYKIGIPNPKFELQKPFTI